MKSFLIAFLLFCVGCSAVGSKTRTATIGRDPTWAPLGLGQVTVNINGFTNALIEQLSRQEGQNWHLVDVSWNQLLEGLKVGDYAGIVTGLTPDRVTEEYYLFSDPFLGLGPVLVVPITSTVHTLEELSGSTLGVYQYDDSVLIAQKVSTLVIEPYQAVTSALDQIVQGTTSGALIPALDAKRLIPHLYADRLKIVTLPLSNQGLRLVAPRDRGREFIDIFNKGLKKLQEKGTYQQLLEHYSVE